MYISHKIKLNPNAKQLEYFERAAGCDRFCWNLALEEWNRLYACGEKCDVLEIKKEFNAHKYEAFPWMKDIHKDAHSDSFYRVGDAWNVHFKSPNKFGKPKFKSKGERDSFYMSNNVIRFSGKKMLFPRLGWVRMTEALRFSGKVMSAVASRTADKWFVSVKIILNDAELKKERSGNEKVGVDLGISTAVTLSTGEKILAPKPLRKALKKLSRCKRSQMRKTLGGRNRNKINKRMARIYAKCGNIRRDFWHKISTRLCRENQAIAIEKLNVRGMAGNRCVSRALSDVGFGALSKMLAYKCAFWGNEITLVDRWFPSSKTCSQCGIVKETVSLSERKFECICGFSEDRDVNAAINIRNKIRSVGPESMPVDWGDKLNAPREAGNAASVRHSLRRGRKGGK